MSVKHIFLIQACPEEFIIFDESKFPQYRFTRVYTEIGKTNAAYNVTRAICEQGKPDLAINLGTAGADNVSFNVGDIKVCNSFFDRDLNTVSIVKGLYDLKNTDRGLLPDSDKATYGTCSTGDEFVVTPQNNADVYEMEAMGAATPCAKFGIPFFAVKYVSDILGKNSITTWQENVIASKTVLGKWLEDYLTTYSPLMS